MKEWRIVRQKSTLFPVCQVVRESPFKGRASKNSENNLRMKEVYFFTGTSDLYGANKILLNTMKVFSDYRKILVVPEDGPLVKRVKKDISDVDVKICPEIPVMAKKFLSPKGISKFIHQLMTFKKIFKKSYSKDSIIFLNTLAVLPISWFVNGIRILHIHEILSNKGFLNRLVNKLAYRSANDIICVSKATSYSILEVNKDPYNKVKTVYNGIDSITTDNNKKDEEIVNIYLIGRIKPEIKGQLYALEAINNLPSDSKMRIRVKFVGSPVPGEEHCLNEINQRITEFDLTDIVSIEPFTNTISSLYKDADICLVPSVRADPFPTTVLEAMSAGIPVIGTDIGGIPEMIVNNETGYLIPINEPDHFSELLNNLIINKELRKSMGNRGKEIFEKNFTLAGYNQRLRSALPSLFEP